MFDKICKTASYIVSDGALFKAAQPYALMTTIGHPEYAFDRTLLAVDTVRSKLEQFGCRTFAERQLHRLCIGAASEGCQFLLLHA